MVTDVLHNGKVRLADMGHDPLVVAWGGAGVGELTDGVDDGVRGFVSDPESSSVS
jgi:hypothetical protein